MTNATERLSNAALLAALRSCVEDARARLDTGQGVKMLYSDVASLSNAVWTVGLNPGGSHHEPDQWHREDGAHDYRDGYLNPGIAKRRPGGLKLRQQLSAMLSWLGLAWSETLSLNLVPFRSRRWDAMPSEWRVGALEFASTAFWPLLLAHRRPALVIAFGDAAARTLRDVLHHPNPRKYSVGWGNVSADISHTDATAILRLPHLSTFRIFDRANAVGANELAALRSDRGLREALIRSR